MTARAAVSLAFFVLGGCFACIACRIPDIQRSLGMDEAQVGLALMSCAVGALAGVAVAGGICARNGSHKVTVWAGVGCCVCLAGLSIAWNLWVLFGVFLCYGALSGVMDVAMNTNGVAVEKQIGRPIMSSLHGMFSLGGLVWAGVGWALVKMGISVPEHFVGASVLLAGTMLWILPSMQVAIPPKDKLTPAFVLPERAVLLIGIIAFSAFLSEGAMGDWSAIYLRKVLHQSDAASTLGYFAFSLAMTTTRFGGDSVLRRFGPTATLRVSGLITAVGLGSALWFGIPWLTILGFATVGLGMATVAPIAFSVGGRMGGDNPDHAIGSIATMAYIAFLVGPSAIGFIAKSSSLREALIVVVVLSLTIVALAGAATER
ncbi:MAG: MFS transporter [Fimbriimonas sp.]|nr:MFS transporter [Fimbriimonas sp.]